MKGELNGYLGATTLFWIVNISVLLNGLRERLVRKLKVGWKKEGEFGNCTVDGYFCGQFDCTYLSHCRVLYRIF